MAVTGPTFCRTRVIQKKGRISNDPPKGGRNPVNNAELQTFKKINLLKTKTNSSPIKLNECHICEVPTIFSNVG